ncbi:MAG: methylenetetrahydrofolate reductase [Candidatus Glassbacteria bacterium]|nr:methylenetetrahydrofolate reductase [Candidatus Glassbacteria bacterium]
MSKVENRFRDKLAGADEFVISVELVPTRGLMRKGFEELIAFTEAALDYGKIDALSLTDNPGGNPRLAPDVLGLDILFRGMSPLVHMTCKDHNRNGLESRAFQLHRMGIENVLALTGDYPVDGYRGVAKPSFDLDSVSLVRMLSDMNRGLQAPSPRPGKFMTLEPTDFFIGASVSPFKQERAELLGQYFKLEKKIKNGADFIITQLGYDMRKFDELLRYLRAQQIEVPVLGNVYVLHRFVSKIMNQNQVPGCVVTDRLLDWVNRQAASPDKGKAAFIEFAARQVAIMKGLGFRGAHIGGFGLSFADKKSIIDSAEEIGDDWRSFVKDILYSQDEEFFFFERDEETRLNTGQPAEPGRKKSPGPRVEFELMKFVHNRFFEPGTAGYKLAKGVCSCIDRNETAASAFTSVEKAVKYVLNNCQGCGDCSLAEMAFLCPESGCAKGLRNGPCGGSFQGICELDDRKCFWMRVVKRWDKEGKLDKIRDPEPVFRNAALQDSSSWLNYFMGRDHAKLGQEKKEEEKQD